MNKLSLSINEQKSKLANIAVERLLKSKQITTGSLIGLGSGSTSELFIKQLGKRLSELERKTIVFYASSKQSLAVARAAKLNVLSGHPDQKLGLYIDGADEVVHSGKWLIKGGGGCLLKEKLLASTSQLRIVLVDASKCKRYLGKYPLPVEITRFDWQNTALRLARVFAEHGILFEQTVSDCLRKNSDGSAFISEEKNYIVDFNCKHIKNPELLSQQIKAVVGTVEHGLFHTHIDEVWVMGAAGRVSVHNYL